MIRCWQADPADRPTFEAIYAYFDDFMIQAEPSYREVRSIVASSLRKDENDSYSVHVFRRDWCSTPPWSFPNLADILIKQLPMGLSIEFLFFFYLAYLVNSSSSCSIEFPFSYLLFFSLSVYTPWIEIEQINHSCAIVSEKTSFSLAEKSCWTIHAVWTRFSERHVVDTSWKLPMNYTSERIFLVDLMLADSAPSILQLCWIKPWRTKMHSFQKDIT